MFPHERTQWIEKPVIVGIKISETLFRKQKLVFSRNLLHSWFWLDMQPMLSNIYTYIVCFGIPDCRSVDKSFDEPTEDSCQTPSRACESWQCDSRITSTEQHALSTTSCRLSWSIARSRNFGKHEYRLSRPTYAIPQAALDVHCGVTA